MYSIMNSEKEKQEKTMDTTSDGQINDVKNKAQFEENDSNSWGDAFAEIAD